MEMYTVGIVEDRKLRSDLEGRLKIQHEPDKLK